MITCPKCKKELSDGTRFCDSCGAQIFETFFCPNCGKQTNSEFAFCQNCGASIAEDPVKEQTAVAPTRKKKLSKKVFIFGGIGVAVIAFLVPVLVLIPVLVIFLFSGRGEKVENNFTLYLKDSEIFFTDLKEGSEAWQLSRRLVAIDEYEIDNELLAYVGANYGDLVHINETANLAFYPDKVSDDNIGLWSVENFSLYYRPIDNAEVEAVKIDSSIVSYTVNDSATIVTYLKGEEGTLYQYKVGEDAKVKIASDVKGFEVSDDGTKIGYINSEGSLYLKYADKDKEKIASEVSSLEYLTDDFKTVYYIKEGSLYKQVEGEERVKIASDVDDVIKIYETGEIYYLISEVDEISIMDYVNDDMKDTDAYIIEPEYPDLPASPDYPSWWDYDTEVEYDAAYAAYEEAYEAWDAECDRILTEYYEASDAYWEKENRDELRTYLEDETLEQFSYSLYFYNGTETTVITDAFAGTDYSYWYCCASDAPVIIYDVYNQSRLEKVKLSEVESIYDIEQMVKTSLLSSSERYIAVKTSATVLEQEKEALLLGINSSGTVVYYIDDIPDEKSYGELYRISITDGTVGKAEAYDSDVFIGYCHFVGDDKFVYYKDFKNSKGEMYVNKVKIDCDVNVFNTEVYSDSDKVIYFTDWNDDKEYGTLKIYQDGESVKVADDVHDFSAMDDGRILYLYDYSLNYYKGQLHVWENGETRKIDDDVVCIIPFFDTKYRGYTYDW